MSDPTMTLPVGKTCADCAHVKRCVMLGCTSWAATWCDWAPSRFVDKYRAALGGMFGRAAADAKGDGT